MIKYSFEQKKALVTAYLNGEGGIRTVIKKYGYSNRSQLQRWIVAYQMYGDDGLKISQKTFNYSFEKKLTVVKIIFCLVNFASGSLFANRHYKSESHFSLGLSIPIWRS